MSVSSSWIATLLVWIPALACRVPLSAAPVPALPPGELAVVTYVSNPAQERAAHLLHRSWRRWAGDWAEAPFHVAQAQPEEWSPERLRQAGAVLWPVPPAPGGQNYPFLNKVLALAEAEARLGDRFQAVIYLDAESVVLSQPTELRPGPGQRLAIRPVHLVNQVGCAASDPLDAYWEGIYRGLGGPPPARPPVRSLVDQRELHPYYSCVAFGFDPSLGLMRRWREAFLQRIADGEFQRSSVKHSLHRLFLHQAVLSALVNRELRPEEIRQPSPSANYPMGLHARLAPSDRVNSLEGVAVLYVDELWETTLDWWKVLPADPAIGPFLQQAQTEWHTVAEGLLWEPGRANSYLLTTPEGSLLIDPAGASGEDSFLRRQPGTPRAIVLTHTHLDHTRGLASWALPGVPVLAQREWESFRAHHEMLAGFYARRDAAQGNVPSRPPEDPWPNRTFAEQDTLHLGGREFQLFHAPGETPDHLLVWVPHLRAAVVGDNFFDAFPNLAPPRGSPPRSATAWIASLDRLLALEPEILCPGHSPPLVGKELVRFQVTRLRDALRHVHDATVDGLNRGKSLPELLQTIRLPPDLALSEAYARVGWAVRGIYQSYAGWFDENPATLADEPPSALAPDLLELCGGPAPVIARAHWCLENEHPWRALRLLDLVLTEFPEDPEARRLRDQVLERLARDSRTYLERRWLEAAGRAATPAKN